VVIGDYVYELQFGVEEESLTGEPQLIDLDSTRDEESKEEDPKGAVQKMITPMGEFRRKRWMWMVKCLVIARVIHL
jgi:hypothetical protein